MSIVNTVVIAMKPGWIFVRIADPRPAPDQILHWLRRTFIDWFRAHPAAIFDGEEIVLNDGEPHGINVWFHLDEDQISQETPESPENTFTISVHGDITQFLSTEYVEAVVEDVLGMIRGYPDRPDTLVAVNPRRVAVAVSRQSRRGVVVPVERILPALEDEANFRLQGWLASPVSPFYVVHVDELPD